MFPSSKILMEVLREMLRGEYTIDYYPPKYGLAVNGTVHPEHIITNASAVQGNVLILTKALGTGVLAAGKRVGEAADTDFQAALDSMKQLNMDAALIMQESGVRCATDITGFLLPGHALKLGRESGGGIEIDSRSIPMLTGVYDLLVDGCITDAAFRNLKYAEAETCFEPGLDYNLRMFSADAQTSGDILMCVPAARADSVIARLKQHYPASTVVGSARSARPGKAIVMLS